MKRVMSGGVLVFPCPKCDKTLEIGLHLVEVAADPTRKSGITGTTYGHRVEFVAEAPHLHAAFWGHMVRCHQPDSHPYMSTEHELARIRDGAALLVAEWRAENSAEFALAAQELDELIANPEPCESLAMAVASLRRENAALKARLTYD